MGGRRSTLSSWTSYRRPRSSRLMDLMLTIIETLLMPCVPDHYFLFFISLGSKLRTISFQSSYFSLGSLNGSHACAALIALSDKDRNLGSSLLFITSGAAPDLPSGFRRKRTLTYHIWRNVGHGLRLSPFGLYACTNALSH